MKRNGQNPFPIWFPAIFNKSRFGGTRLEEATHDADGQKEPVFSYHRAIPFLSSSSQSKTNPPHFTFCSFSPGISAVTGQGMHEQLLLPLLKPPHHFPLIPIPPFLRPQMAHKVHSLRKVPFSWENAPGVCKASSRECSEFVYEEGLKLPPPPCPSDSPRISVHRDIHIPLPPCAFQPPPRSCSRKGMKTEDPFLAAYMECTKKGEQGNWKSSRRERQSQSSSTTPGGGIRGRMNLLSCKHSCGVKEDSLVKVVHRSRSQGGDFSPEMKSGRG